MHYKWWENVEIPGVSGAVGAAAQSSAVEKLCRSSETAFQPLLTSVLA